MKYFKCTLEEDGWSHIYTKAKHFIWAEDAEAARIRIAKHWQIRKNAKGLKIEEIEPHNAKMTSKNVTELVTENVWNSFMQHSYPESSYREVKHYYCSHCKGEVMSGDSICIHCGAEFKSSKER